MRFSQVFAISLLVFFASVAFLGLCAAPVTHPGHADPAFYFSVAENLCSGRGFTIDYIWHHLVGYTTVVHPSNDFWMPLPSVIMCGFFKVFGVSYRSAQISSVLFGALLVLLSYTIARGLDESCAVATWVPLVGLSTPLLVFSATIPDSGVYYGVLGSLSLLFMGYSSCGGSEAAVVALAGLFAGLTALTRNDGILLAATFFLNELFVRGRSWADKTRRVLVFFVVFALVVVPWMYYLYETFGTLSPPASSRVPFLQSYDELYSPSGGQVTLQSYLSSGPAFILQQKLVAIGQNLIVIPVVASPILVALFVYYLWSSRRHPLVSAVFRPVLVHTVVLFLSYSLIVTVVGSLAWPRTLVAVLPFLVAGASLGLLQVLRRRRVCGRRVMNGKVLAVYVLGLQALLSALVLGLADSNSGCIETTLNSARDSLLVDGSASDAIILTNAPWEVYYSLRTPAVQAPAESVGVLARRFSATHLLLFDPIHCGVPDLPLRPASFESHYQKTEEIAEASASGGGVRLEPMHVSPEYQLYRIVPR